jgi:RepB DNA-primase from phage plasmid
MARDGALPVNPAATPVHADPDGLRVFLEALYGRDPGRMVEVAHRTEYDGRKGPMHRGRTGIFLPAFELELIEREIERLARHAHVWVGVAPRRPHPLTGELGGRREHVAPARVLWADVDQKGEADPLERLRAFSPSPHMLVHSGGGFHAYWLVAEAIAPAGRLRDLNERLAIAVAADCQSADGARLLRPPGTLNFKSEYGRPRPVRLMFLRNRPPYGLAEIVESLPRQAPAAPRPPRAPTTARAADPLKRLPPALYFRKLAGTEPDRTGKVCCPLPAHDDPEPSCHVYEAPAQGWYCFGCGRGGDIYELAGELWGLRRHGREFIELRVLLLRCFGLDERPQHARRVVAGSRRR